MKQRPVFILLTFFIALASVVLITFVFLRTQLSEHKLQNLVQETIHKNFQDFQISVDQIGLSLGTKFRYKIAKIKIEYKNENGVFSHVDLNNVSIKFPLFFLLGKQDIDVGIEDLNVDGFDFNKWIANKYKITSLTVDSLKIPKFLVDNRINVTIDNINLKNEVGSWPSPIKLKSISHLVMKDFSISDITAIEFNATAENRVNEEDPLLINFVAIGHVRLGQFVSSGIAESKMLLEVKSVNKAEFSWLTNHRLQFVHDVESNKSYLYVHGNALEGKTELMMTSGAMIFRDIDFQLKTEELIKESSLLKNSLFLMGQSLDLANLNKAVLKTKGNLSFLAEEASNKSNWLVHISNQLFSDGLKVDVNVNSHQTGHYINIKLGNDLSYRNIILDCVHLNCYQDNLRSVEVNFYNQILQGREKLSLVDILDHFSSWWGSLLPLLSVHKTTPLKVYWKKNRWNDFEFDLYADVVMNNSIFACENIVIKNFGKDVVDAKLSLTNKDNSALTSRMIIQLMNFPASVMVQLFPETQVDMSGAVTGVMALEFTSNEKKLSADVKLMDGQVSWLNFDDLYRRNVFLKPEDEIRFPNLNWNAKFKQSNITLQWTEQKKLIDFELLLPKNNKKIIKFEFNNSAKEAKAELTFFSLNKTDKKYLQQHSGPSDISFAFSYLPNELKLIDSKPTLPVEN